MDDTTSSEQSRAAVDPGDQPLNPDEEIVEELFLASLSRRPTADEVQVAKHVIAENRKTGVENIEWALLNSTEFLVNH